MKYSINSGKLSLNQYREILKNQNLLPGRRALLKELEPNFFSLAEAGIKNLDELIKALSTAQKLEALSQKTGIPADYLVLLKREIGSLQPKPILLKDFPGIEPSLTEALLQAGIKTSKDFFEIFTSDEEYRKIRSLCPILERAGGELYSLCSLTRINGIGAAAAKCFFDAGFASVADIAEADADDMLVRVSKANGDNKYYRAKLGTKDMQFCIDNARILEHLS